MQKNNCSISDLIEQDYQPLFKKIREIEKNKKTILFAGLNEGSLPVTVIVNTAVRIAEEMPCLLIDLDIDRNAVANVFDIEQQQDHPRSGSKAYSTEFDGLMIWPAFNFTGGYPELAALVRAGLVKFDCLLINKPLFEKSPHQRKLISSTQYAFIFAKDNAQAKKYTKLFNDRDCKILDIFTQ